MKLLSLFKSIFSNNTHIDNQKKVFHTMIAQARTILNEVKIDSNARYDEDYKHPIFSYIKCLGLSTQTQYITELIYAREKEITSPIDKLFISRRASVTADKSFGKIIEDTRNMKVSGKGINLASDLILPWPWNVSRFLGAMARIGKYNLLGEWREDNNHRIEVWLPIGVCFVKGGNHSITAGILKGEGIITNYSTIDLSPIYSLVYTDGVYYYKKIDNSIIGKVQNVEFAAIFEIGRILKELNIEW